MPAGLLALGLAAALRLAAARWPGLAEAHAQRLAGPLAAATGALPSVLPFSVAEPLVLASLLGVPAALAWAARRDLRAGAGRWRAAGRAALRAASAAGFVLLSFDALWGLQYARPELAARTGWTRADGATGSSTAELAALAERLVLATNDAYHSLRGGLDRGSPTTSPALPGLQAALDHGFEAAARLGVGGGGHRPARVKPLAASLLTSHLGLSGFYFPWTAEPNVNRMVPGCTLPHVAAHEMAHRRGFAREDEAQFAGYLACVLSPSPEARYSGLLFAQRELLFQLLVVDPAAARALVARRSPGVQRDVDDVRRFWERYEGPAATAADAVNDAYLHAQGVPGGIDSYRQGARLIVLCARAGHEVCGKP